MNTVFAKNLEMLIQRDESVSASARRMGINRSQLNRYRSGRSLPRPDALARICATYGVDERILSQPLANLTFSEN